jgi:serine phosphatase RsbU (regulator of sigma subunit)
MRKADNKILSVSSSIDGEVSNNKLEPILEENGLSLFQIKEDRQPVGFLSEEQQPFTNHEVQLLKDDIVYIFSDGFQDQFGGPKGKKFMIKQLKNLLIEVAPKPLAEQRELLDKALMDWMDHPNEMDETIEQVDDVLFIGVKVT